MLLQKLQIVARVAKSLYSNCSSLLPTQQIFTTKSINPIISSGRHFSQHVFNQNSLSFSCFKKMAVLGSLNVPGHPSSLLRLLGPVNSTVQQVRTYKVRAVLKRRCKGCYFEKRLGRWYVECTLKPRHKQMQKMHKSKLYRDDYSKGNIRLAAHWGWQKKRIYWQGDNVPRDLYKPFIDYNTTTVSPPV